MKCQSKDATQVTVVLSDDFVLLQVPTFHLLVFTSGEEVRVAVRDDKPSYRVDVSRESHLELASCQVPKLDCPIVAARDEKLIHRVDGKATHPAVVASDDSL